MVLGDQWDLFAVLKWARWFGEQRDLADNFAAAHSDSKDEAAPEGIAFSSKLLKAVVATVCRLLRTFIAMETGHQSAHSLTVSKAAMAVSGVIVDIVAIC